MVGEMSTIIKYDDFDFYLPNKSPFIRKYNYTNGTNFKIVVTL